MNEICPWCERSDEDPGDIVLDLRAELSASEARVRDLEAREAYLQKCVDRFECREAAYGNFERPAN